MQNGVENPVPGLLAPAGSHERRHGGLRHAGDRLFHVVSGGHEYPDSAEPSKDATAISPRTVNPASWMARNRPIAGISEAAKIAVSMPILNPEHALLLRCTAL